jgi:uncharacterized protein YjbI with pentapeptide repeats
VASGEGREFRGVRLDDADFSGARLHSPNFEGTRITDGWLREAEISGFIAGLRVNGVEVAPLVEAELDRCFPERVKLRARDPQGLADAWAMIEDVWRTTVARQGAA